jgi:signal transduction histidine kinase
VGGHYIGPARVEISVSDNGRGMPFLAAGLSGIGLAAIRSKVKLLDGHVEISGRSGGGTHIEVSIPHQGLVNK